MKTLLTLIFGLVFAASFPSPTGNISDFAGVLNQEQVAQIEQNLQSFRDKTGNQIAVAIIKDLNGDTVENTAVQMFEQWKIGQKGNDNGILLLISINDHKLKIEVGYGLEGQLNDAKAGDIIRNVISPKFKQNDYSGGILDGVNAIENTISGSESASTPTTTTTTNAKGVFAVFGILIWFLFPLLIYIAAFFGRSKAIWPGGLVGLIIGAIIAGLIGAIIAGLIGLFLDWILSKNYERLSKLGKKTNFWHSGGGFWTGGSGSSGGGFGGFGGGSSGGGGASGSW